MCSAKSEHHDVGALLPPLTFGPSRRGERRRWAATVACTSLGVGLLTLDVCASAAGLHALRRSDGLWVPVEETALRADGGVALVVMVGDTLARLSAGHFAPCKHRVVAPRPDERIGLPFLFRGRSDAVLDTRPALAAAAAAGRVAHLAELETVTIRDLPSFDSARSILKGWFRSVRKPKPIESAM